MQMKLIEGPWDFDILSYVFSFSFDVIMIINNIIIYLNTFESTYFVKCILKVKKKKKMMDTKRRLIEANTQWLCLATRSSSSSNKQ